MSEKDDLATPAPINIKQESWVDRVGLSKKGKIIVIGALSAASLAIMYGIFTAGPKSKAPAAESAQANSDLPGVTSAPNMRDIAATRASDEPVPEQEPPAKIAVRGSEQQASPQQQSSSPQRPGAPGQQMTPAEQHRLWLEKKKYERIQGQILASDMAVSADLMKGNANLGGARSMSAPAQDDPLARLAALRNNAHSAVAAASPGAVTAALPGAAVAASPTGLLATGGDPNVAAQARNKEFLKEAAETGYLPERVKPKMGQHELAAGSVIPAVLLTGINSDLPGVITAQVRQTIYDTFDESTVVIPQGTRVVGRYSSQVAYGQERVLVAWDELIMPNGNRINIRGMPGADGIGQAGFNDQVDAHFWRIWGSAFMVSMLGVGVQLSQPQNSSYQNAPTASQQASAAAANSLNQAGSKVLDKNMNLSPTLTVRPGYAFNIIINKSIMLPAYRDF